MNEKPSTVRVSFYSSSGEWYATENVEWSEGRYTALESFARVVGRHVGGDPYRTRRLSGMTATLHPLSVTIVTPHPEGGCGSGCAGKL